MTLPPNVIAVDSPSVVTQDNGQIDLFVRGGDNVLAQVIPGKSLVRMGSLGGVRSGHALER
jgi:hypothetical protein